MSSDISITVDGLSKCYHIYDRPQDRLRQIFAQDGTKHYREFWAMRNVSFKVRRGETVGIVGRNGSGKSTLLQMICGTLNPTEGQIQTHGRIAALLELGTGFNPDFTGRENVFMNAAVLGLSDAETERRFDSIAAFADIGDFLEQPVKTYSSGMAVRLAFSVAINVDPQILVVDEALSVGDELFQRKCFSRIEAIKQSGATILFVSHSGAAVVDLCDRALLLDGGELLTSGQPKAIVGKYQKLLYAPEAKRETIRQEIQQLATDTEASTVSPPAPQNTARVIAAPSAPTDDQKDFFDPFLVPQSTIAYESHGVVIHSPNILNQAGAAVNCLLRGQTYRCSYIVQFDEAASNVRFGMMIKTASGTELGGTVTAPNLQEAVSYLAAGTSVKIDFSFECLLNTGVYYMNTGVVGMKNGEETYLHRLLDATMFRVLPVDDNLVTALVDFRIRQKMEIEER